MGIKESYPVIKGKSVSLKTKEQKQFFNRIHTILKKDYMSNTYSDYNLIQSLETKSFINGTKKPNKRDIRDMTWIEYLIICLNKLQLIYNEQWMSDLLIILKEKNINIPENKYYSDFFFHEYQIKSMPKIFNLENEKTSKNPTYNYWDICCGLYDTEVTLVNDNNYDELDVLDNLGGSYLEVNYDDLLPDDPTLQYHKRRNNVKKYMRIFRDHLYNNVDHPIHQIIYIFNNLFSKFIQNRLRECEFQLEKNIINQDKFNTLINNLEEEVTNCLQEFITSMHSATKLFYSTTIDYKFLEEEKDDLINMITSLFFRTGKLYESILNLYSYSFKDQIQNFKTKLFELKSVKPNQLGIEIKFCLNEDTIKLQNKLKQNKITKNENNNLDKEQNKDINTSSKKMKKTSLFQKLSEENKNNLYTIKENEDEKNDNLNIIGSTKNQNNKGKLVYYLDENDNDNVNDNENENLYLIKNDHNETDYNIPVRSKTKFSNIFKEDDYILERLSFLEDSRNEAYYNPANQIRNSVNNFNNKTYFFPKLHNQLKKNMNLNDDRKNSQYSRNKEKIDNNLPLPYLSAINLMKSLRKYKTPFEKIILIAAISDQIMESATNFWKDMEPYIEKDYLFIEADEIMTIFLYIIIQSQMPEIFLYCKIINNFTTQFTKAFNIAYNYTLLEASLDYINGIKDIKELYQKEKGFLDASRSIIDISNQRISRISLGISKDRLES